MIAVGEETGDLSGSLMYISDMYEDEISDLTKNLTTLLEPVLMLVMGAHRRIHRSLDHHADLRHNAEPDPALV